MPLTIVRNDLTKMKVDAIVNSANTRLVLGDGVYSAIFKVAGKYILQTECEAIGSFERGEAVITRGYNLPASHIIHTVGPVWNGGKSGETLCLRSCYINSLQLAVSKDCKPVAFPLISSGIYSYPKEEALQIALSAIKEFLLTHELDIYLVVFDREAFSISRELFNDVKRYIDDNYVDETMQDSLRHRKQRPHSYSSMHVDESVDDNASYSMDVSYSKADDTLESKKITWSLCRLEDLEDNLAESFSDMLLRLKRGCPLRRFIEKPT